MQTFLLLLLKYKYLILFPLAAIEGPIVALVVGYLVFAGVLNFWLSYIILLFGDLIPDSVYYCFGLIGDRSDFVKRHFLDSTFFTKNFGLIRRIWDKHPRKTMTFGKLAYGLSITFLISAGMVKIPYKKFLSYTIPVTLFQYGVIMTVGYFLGNSYSLAVKYVDYTYYLFAIIVVLAIIIYILLTKFAREKIISMEEENK